MLSRVYFPPALPGTGYRSTVMVEYISGVRQNAHGAVNPSPYVSSRYTLRRRRSSAEPRLLLLVVPRRVGLPDSRVRGCQASSLTSARTNTNAPNANRLLARNVPAAAGPNTAEINEARSSRVGARIERRWVIAL